jgi:branched-chain amino acid transport system permease protein
MSYITTQLTFACIYIILAVSQNLIVGFTGMLNLGHAAFYGIGAYTSALLAFIGIPFPFNLLAAGIVAGFFGLLLGMPTFRLRGDYLAIVTLGFGEIIRNIMKNWVGLTRGPLGLPGIPKFEIFGYVIHPSNVSYFILAFLVMVLTVFIINRLVKSPFGRVLRAIREDEIAAQALGKNTVKYKVMALVIGAFFAGIAGSLFAHFIMFIDPSTFTLLETALILAMVVLGGLGSIKGSIIGALIITWLAEPLRFLEIPDFAIAALRTMIYSLILIILMIYRPAGLFGEKRFKTNVNNTKSA